ncbi:hypothetical protein [Larkinella sp. C7]|uniref:hypothetical protein n=1 Tax=Larkinella sp. C7 TaxID=2576607 RepID=UPI00111108BF|nr:hypothetical protein [Larkinella sp. C7]
MPQITNSVFWSDDLPNDPEALKACIHRQAILLGYQLIELDHLQEDLRQLKRQNRRLKTLLTPTN